MDKIWKQSPFSQVRHVGIIVRDMQPALKKYEALGMGPFQPFSQAVKERRVRGKVVPEIKLKVMTSQLGEIQFELIQPLEGQSPQKEFLEKNGERIHHLGFFTRDLKGDRDRLVKMGYEVIYSADYVKGGGCDYYINKEHDDEIVWELIEWPADKA
jgi:methylmalonyl-CoA/ethylmalonyl-CoA epimerase